MRITRLELHGFKSFAERTTLAFGPGISCVVGPNGCGKSNIVDALRWVIGEQRAKSLRGSEMADVIFAGSTERKPAGFAEVSIGLGADADTPFPGEYARFPEISVARRLYRTGASEYLINQVRVRRKDVVDLFMDSGAGNDLYSFIEQGRIDKVVSASPADRRALIDEAAGITRALQHRDESVRELEVVRNQLDRVADVVDTLLAQTRSLEQASLQAARYRALRAQLRQHEVVLALAKLHDMEGLLGEQEARLRVCAEQLLDAEADMDDLQARHEREREALTLSEDRLQHQGARKAEVEAARREVLARVELERRSLDELRTRVGREAAEVQQMEASSLTVNAESEAMAHNLEALAHACGACEHAQHIAAQTEAECAGQARQAREFAEQAAHLHTELQAGVYALQGELGVHTARLDEKRTQILQLQSELQSVQTAQLTAGKRLEVAQHAGIARKDERIAAEAVLADAVERAAVAEREEHHAEDALKTAEDAHDLAQSALSEAIAAAEQSAGQADEWLAARMERERMRQETQSQAAEREDAVQIAARERSLREQATVRERELRAAHDRVRTALERDLAAARSLAEKAENTLRARCAEREASTRAEGRAAVQQALAQVQAESEVKLARVAQEVTEAAAQEKAAMQGLTDASALRERSQRALARAQALCDALEAEIEASGAQDAGSAAIDEAFPNAPRLADVLVVPEAERAHAAKLLGDRLLLRVLDPSQLVQAAAVAATAGPARLWVGSHPDWESLLRDVTIVPDLPQALEAHARLGGSAVVRGSGERVERDGVVFLGQDAVVDPLARRDALAEARKSVEHASDTLAAHEAAWTAAGARLEATRIAHRDALSRQRTAEAEARTGAERVLAEATECATRELEALQTRHQTERRDALAERERTLAAQLEANQRTLAEDLDRMEHALAQLREAHEAELSEAKAEQSQQAQVRRAEVQAQLEAYRVRARDEIRASVEDIAVTRELRSAEVAACREGLLKARARHTRAREALQKAQASVSEHERTRHGLVQIEIRLTSEAQAASRQVEELTARTGAITTQCEALAVEIAQLQARVVSEQADLERKREQWTQAQSALARATSASETVGQAWQQAREALEAATAKTAVARQQHAVALTHAQALSRERTQNLTNLEAATERLRASTVQKDETEARLQGIEQQADRLSSEAQAVVQAHAQALAAHTEQRERFASLEGIVQEKDTALGLLRQEAVAIEQEIERQVMTRTAMLERFDERYQLDLMAQLAEFRARGALRLSSGKEAAEGLVLGQERVEGVPDFVLSLESLSDTRQIRSHVGAADALRKTLSGFGEVHLGALEEYRQVRARADELIAQREDMEASVARLREGIATINAECKLRFREAFDAVNLAFRVSYPELVGGGEAFLELTDAEDLLTTGVEIIVRPPGKRLQNLALLSGGEKAMTAIALLLALFSVKPSPFCVLDEVDAPLDEANGGRFNEMLRQMSQKTQFLVVTHNRKTMECADALYGITMPTPGCSALVGVRID